MLPRTWMENPRGVLNPSKGGTHSSQFSLNIGTQTVRIKHGGGQYESSCSRSSYFGAFSGCRIGTGGVSPLWLCTLWLPLRSGLRLLRLPSSLPRLPSSLLRLLSSLPPSSPLVSLLKETF